MSTKPLRQRPGRPRRSPVIGLAISIITLAALVAIAIIMSNPSPRVTGITVASALDEGYEAVTPTDTFHPSDTFFVSVQIADYRSDQNITAHWRFNGKIIHESVLETHGAAGTITAGFSASNTEPWPVGPYSVDIANGDTILTSATFRVAP